MMNVWINKLRASQILGAFMVAVIMITTSGFSVFHHYCNTTRVSEYSLIIPEFSCEHQHHNSDGLPACCADEPGSTHQSCGMADCCTTDVITVKLNISLITQDITPWQSQLSCMAVDHSMVLEDEKSSENGILPVFNNNHSPPLSGRDLHIFIHQLNIPDPTV